MAVPDLQDALDCLQKKDVDEAIALLKKKIDDLPAHLTAHVLLARAFETKKDWKRALTCWENAHFLMPNSPVAREGKERVLEKMDQSPEATQSDTPEDAPDDAQPSSAPSVDIEPQQPSDAHQEQETASDPSPERPPSPSSEGPSDLDELRQQTEEESHRQTPREKDARPEGSIDAPSDDSADDRIEALGEQTNGDLDRLIDDLESARIEPDPDVEDVEPPDLSHETEDLVSETLARIYEAQDEFRQAAQIYVKLASQEPEQARSYLERAAEMREKAEEQANTGD